MKTERNAPWMRSLFDETGRRESEDQLRRAFESAPTGFAIVGRDECIRAVNRSLCDMLGYAEAELVGKTFPAHTHPDDLAQGAAVLSQLLDGQVDSARFEKRYIHKDGSVVRGLLSLALVRDGGGVGYFVSQVTDLTPLKEAEEALARTTTALRESEERFREAFESAATGCSLVELDGTIRAANRSMCAMLGYTEDEMLRQTFGSISHPDDTEPAASLRRQLVNGEIDHFQIENRYLHKDGHIIWADAAAALAHVSDGALYFVVQLTDITRRKNAEEALARHRKDLERSNEDLQSFAYVASHDLQQPLRTVASYAHLLAERYHGYLDERADRWLAHMTRGVDRMQHLIADLLQLSQLRRNSEGFSPTDLGPIVGRIWEVLYRQYLADAHFTCGDLPTIMADAAQMELLMQNLIDNSFKYRRANVPLEIRLSAERHDEKDHAMWEFALRDNGIGFESIYAERIFDLLRRLHSPDKYEGTGIGLTLCRRIVERHGGRIRAESAPGQGSTFLFTLPEQQRQMDTPSLYAGVQT
jgi:PAS domain S-box-containing protein